ncbi:GAF and ANTAR domain-containing protein [Amycolatopsis sp. NPDC059027]|uniref:GAF and ANTAR domain-containing protein n=1 Tax=unclassified Amycolatopsis TaxID=2618356 RepID=UPI00366C6161
MVTVHDGSRDDSRLAKLWTSLSELARARRRRVTVEFVCEAVVDRFGVKGACLVVGTGAGTAELRYATGELGTRLTEIEATVGEGPGSLVLRTGVPVLVADLEAPAIGRRWPLFVPLAVEAGARSCHVLPLSAGASRAGALTLYCAEPGSLPRAAVGEALSFAELVWILLLNEQTHTGGGKLVGSGNGFPLLSPQVHQAAGMVAAQLDVSLEDAYARLRARAFAEHRGLAELAADVVARRLRFAPERDPG